MLTYDEAINKIAKYTSSIAYYEYMNGSMKMSCWQTVNFIQMSTILAIIYKKSISRVEQELEKKAHKLFDEQVINN